MLNIVFEDEYSIFLNKEHGIPCLGEGITLESKLIEKYSEQKKVQDSGICHRLDNATAGLVLVAKTQEYYDLVRKLFKENNVQKYYFAKVEEGLENISGKIDTPIAHSKKSRKKMLAIFDHIRNYRSKPRAAVTYYRVLKDGWLLVKIKTGVRHQIRVHLKSIGHSIIGDELYGSKDKYLHLISKTIKFQCPIRKKLIKVSA